MNDRYLFKAKRIDNGKWVQGYLFDDGFENGRMFVGGLVVEKYIGAACDDCTVTGTNFCEIDPSTICKCTGLKDKNGKLIWDNDVVKFDVYYYGKLESSTISQIKWCNDLCALSLVVNGRGTRGTLGHLMDLNKEIEVIGNIFDNPELVKNKEN